MKKKIFIIITVFGICMHLSFNSQVITGFSLPGIKKCLAESSIIERLKTSGIIPQQSKIYYDIKTKHIYQENEEGLFSEYNKKGKLGLRIIYPFSSIKVFLSPRSFLRRCMVWYPGSEMPYPRQNPATTHLRQIFC